MAMVQVDSTPGCEFRPITDDDAPTPAAHAVTMRVQLCEADLVAALFHATDTCVPASDLDDDDVVRLYVSEGLLDGGLERISETRQRIATAGPRSTEATWAHLCARRVREVYAIAAQQPPSRRPGRRTLTTAA